MTKNSYQIIFKVLVCTLIMISCGTKNSYHVKSFFFDGVPEPITTQEIDSLMLDTLSIAAQDSIKAIKKPQEIIHLPFQEKNCKTCHQKYSRSQSMANNKSLCYTCHDSFENTYQTLHGPVTAGYCTQCHNPHKSKFQGLVLHNDNQLCYNCHNQDDVQQNNIHNTLEGTQQCLTCHSPHGSNTRYLLTRASCFECHENYNTSNTYVHGPVAAGLCAQCHEDHSSKQPHLLTNTTNTLCLNCHNNQDLNKTTAHNKIKTELCTTCHNPHGGSNRNLLTQNTNL